MPILDKETPGGQDRLKRPPPAPLLLTPPGMGRLRTMVQDRAGRRGDEQRGEGGHQNEKRPGEESRGVTEAGSAAQRRGPALPSVYLV